MRIHPGYCQALIWESINLNYQLDLGTYVASYITSYVASYIAVGWLIGGVSGWILIVAIILDIL
jgi:hypothetical protein